MEETPEMVYDRHEGAIYVERGSDRTMLYPSATRKEFAVISDIDDLLTNAAALSDKLLETLQKFRELIRENQYFGTLNTFQQDAGDYYEECRRFQSIAKGSSSDIVEAQLGQLYKLEKFLKHYFRQITVAQSLGFSEQLLFTYLSTHHYVFLYGFVRNACSTLEYLGKLLESRQGEGSLGLADQNKTFKHVYQELQRQGLGETFTDSQMVTIPEREEPMEMGNLSLSDAEIEFLWHKRNDIVHHCPIVVEEKTVEHLPDDLLTTSVLTETDIEKLTQLASRVHVHSIGMFLKFSEGYMSELIEQMGEAWYHEDPTGNLS